MRAEHSIPAIKTCKVPFVFVHGMCCEGKIFEVLMKALGNLGYESFAVTLREHRSGPASPGAGRVSIRDHITDVERFLLALGRRVILSGHSMGEIIAASVAKRNESLVVAHIGMTSAPPRGVFMGIKMILRLHRYLLKMILHQPLKLTAADTKYLLFNRLSAHDAEKLIAELGYESGAAAFEMTYWKYDIERLSSPSLVIGAQYDNITPNQRAVARKLGAEFLEVPCCHMVMNDPQYMSVVQVIDTWLNQKIQWAFAV